MRACWQAHDDVAPLMRQCGINGGRGRNRPMAARMRSKAMRIERHYTQPGVSPLRPRRLRDHQERNPQSRRLGRVFARRRRGSGRLEPGRGRRAGAEIFPQSRRAGAAEAGRGGGRSRPSCGARSPTRPRSSRCRRPSASAPRPRPSRCSTASPAPGPIGAGRRGYFDGEDDARAYYDEMRLMLARQIGRAQFAAMVQHRPPLGLWRRWAEPGPLLRRLRDRQDGQVEVGLRASAAARLLHPVGRRRSRQRGRDHGPLGARGAPVQIRLRHRHQFLGFCAARTRSSPAAGARPASCRS